MIMKKPLYLISIISVLLIAFFAGCGSNSPEQPDNPNPEPEIPTPDTPDDPAAQLPVPGLSFSSVILPNEGDTFSCTIHGLANNDWSAESSESWCDVSVKDSILKITVEPNLESNDARSTAVSILQSDKTVIGWFYVRQQSTTNENPLESSIATKQSFFPVFTATWCPFSPDMDRTLPEIQKRWDYPILPMRIHVKNSALYIPLSGELSQLYGNTSTPTGYFENYFQVGNMSDGNVSVDHFWNLIMSNTCLGSGYTSLCSTLGCKASMSETQVNAEITIDPLERGEYRLQAFIVEDNVISPQMSKTGDEFKDYCHNSVLKGALTPADGQMLEMSSLPKTFKFSGSIPDGANPSNLRLLIVLQRNAGSLNYSNQCWYADNCLSVPLGKTAGNGTIENIYVGDEIQN